jgi:exodeoxyribonuclease III
MKLCSWNVNGIRSVHQKGFLDWLRNENPDVVCLQEVKANPDQVPVEVRDIDGYRSSWHPATKRGYSGVTIYSKVPVISVKTGLGHDAFDCEGRVIQAEFADFVLLNAYFPNSQRDHARLGFKLDFCEAMLAHMDQLRSAGKNVVLCGDFNIAHQDIDLKNPKQNEKNAGFLPEERAWFSKLMGQGYLDAFRLFQPEGGHYTWWSYRPTIRERNIGWRLDYFVCNPEMRNRIQACTHRPQILGSDHCPVVLELGMR